MMALAGFEPETLVSEPDALTTQPYSFCRLSKNYLSCVCSTNDMACCQKRELP